MPTFVQFLSQWNFAGQTIFAAASIVIDLSLWLDLHPADVIVWHLHATVKPWRKITIVVVTVVVIVIVMPIIIIISHAHSTIVRPHVTAVVSMIVVHVTICIVIMGDNASVPIVARVARRPKHISHPSEARI